jgi:ppGpp synthetase/RelA/SpoT-type nucleotidyltranferase
VNVSPKKNVTETYDLQQLEQEYQALRPVMEGFSKELTNQLQKLLDDAGISLGFPIQSRVKTWDSISEKLERLPRRFKGVKEIQDLVGVRIILLFHRDIERTGALLANNFQVTRQYNTMELLGADRFGYSSVHYIVELPKEWLAVPTLAKMGGLIAEIQVRTLAQHIWAETSNKLQYKQEESVPPAVRRAISRASALLETLDLEFERVLIERDAYRGDL